MNNDRFLTRVFDKQEKEMLRSGIEYGEITNKGFYKLCDHVYFIPFGDRYVPMQCYGKRDKNNKLLYDNNILQEKNGNTYCLEFDGTEWMIRYIKYNVEYKGQKMPAPYTPWGGMWGGTDKIDDEIIGNIHENPELLEAKA